MLEINNLLYFKHADFDVNLHVKIT